MAVLAPELVTASRASTQAGELAVTVRSRRALAEDVIELRLGSDEQLPTWSPGAHVDLLLPSGTVRQYSLCGAPEDTSAYTVAVLRDPEGRGGSIEVHELAEGTEVTVRGPRNHFTLRPADHYLLVAGGIGITPLLAMARELEARGASWRAVYGGRSRRSMAYLDDLVKLGGEQVRIVPQDEVGIIDLAAELADLAPDTHMYACGPEAMLRAVEDEAERRGLVEAVHLERFGAAASTETVGATEDRAFQVECARNGAVLQVPCGTRLIDVVRQVAPQVPFSCEEGYCGSCETAVLDGIPDHRDQVLSVEERAANDTMMICVGRAKSARLVLDV
jgi:ferredoxin-NADP reductase